MPSHWLEANGYLFLNCLDPDHYTREGNTIRTYIDHVFTNITNTEFNLSLSDIPISDHRVIAISMKLNSNNISIQNRQLTYQITNYNEIEKNRNELISIANSASFSDFHMKLISLIDKYTKTIVKKSKIKKTWATNELLEHINERDK